MGTQLDLFAAQSPTDEPREPWFPEGHLYPDNSSDDLPLPVAESQAVTAIASDEPYCLADRIMDVMRRQTAQADKDLQELRVLHAEIIGCSVEELDAVVAKQDADQKAAREASKAAPKQLPIARPEPTHCSRSAKPNKSATTQPMRRLTDRQQELLACLVIDGDRAIFGPNDHIDDWPALKQVMLLLGSKWKTGGKKQKGAFVFPGEVDAAETFRLAQAHGEIFDPKLVGTFLTPAGVADYAASKLVLAPNMRVLEPEAGTGNLATALLRACPKVIVECVELLEAHQRELAALGLPIIGTDFLQMKPDDHTAYDAVLMNPPFSNGAEAHHVLHAAKCVIPGGQVVAIVSQGVTFRQTSPYVEFARWLKAHGTIEALPDGSFKESGTMIQTALITAKTCGWCRTGTCWER